MEDSAYNHFYLKADWTNLCDRQKQYHTDSPMEF